MPLLTATIAQYLTDVTTSWRHTDFNACKFVKAIKGEKLNGYAYVPVGTTFRRLDSSNAGSAVHWAAERLADIVRRTQGNRAISFVPIPPSRSVVASPQLGPPHHLAKGITLYLQNSSEVIDTLQWKHQVVPAKEGGPRDPGVLEQNLAIVASIPQRDVILVDDVLTTGGHAVAAARLLRRNGATVAMMVAAGRSTAVQEPDPFAEDFRNLID